MRRLRETLVYETYRDLNGAARIPSRENQLLTVTSKTARNQQPVPENFGLGPSDYPASTCVRQRTIGQRALTLKRASGDTFFALYKYFVFVHSIDCEKLRWDDMLRAAHMKAESGCLKSLKETPDQGPLSREAASFTWSISTSI
jgi:hypothetical protein